MLCIACMYCAGSTGGMPAPEGPPAEGPPPAVSVVAIWRKEGSILIWVAISRMLGSCGGPADTTATARQSGETSGVLSVSGAGVAGSVQHHQQDPPKAHPSPRKPSRSRASPPQTRTHVQQVLQAAHVEGGGHAGQASRQIQLLAFCGRAHAGRRVRRRSPTPARGWPPNAAPLQGRSGATAGESGDMQNTPPTRPAAPDRRNAAAPLSFPRPDCAVPRAASTRRGAWYGKQQR